MLTIKVSARNFERLLCHACGLQIFDAPGRHVVVAYQSDRGTSHLVVEQVNPKQVIHDCGRLHLFPTCSIHGEEAIDQNVCCVPGCHGNVIGRVRQL
jgi:hypothetical protein